MISVILPTYERANAVLCALAGLEQQSYQDFEIVLIDDSDGSAIEEAVGEAMRFPLEALPGVRIDTRELREGLEELRPVILSQGEWSIEYTWPKVRYIRSGPPRTGRFTAGRARNFGAANARYPLLVFIDQDVILAPDALARYADAYGRHGDNTIILGLYHWLVRMDFGPEDVRTRFNDICLEAMPKLPMDEPGILGPDLREVDFTDDMDGLVDDAALGAWSGNIGYPRELFLKLGGFDEVINRHGGEDADLGLTAKEHGAKFLCYRKIWGVHRWHSRNQAQNAREVQLNIEYIDRKHGVGQYAGAKRFGEMDAQDWRSAAHYHKDLGAVLMQMEGDPTVWVCREGHRLGLPTSDWVARLGFVPGEVLLLLPDGLADYVAEGVAGVV